MQCQDAGSLTLPTGRLVACDPQFDLVQRPFRKSIEPGDYPVFVSLVWETVALVMVQFDEGEPERWRSSRPECFSVDSGTACLLDAKTARRLSRIAEAGKWDRFWKRVEDGMAETQFNWANTFLSDHAELNAFVFRTFGGDGTFATYWGYGADGRLLCCVTDTFLEFGVDEIT